MLIRLRHHHHHHHRYHLHHCNLRVQWSRRDQNENDHQCCHCSPNLPPLLVLSYHKQDLCIALNHWRNVQISRIYALLTQPRIWLSHFFLVYQRTLFANQGYFSFEILTSKHPNILTCEIPSSRNPGLRTDQPGGRHLEPGCSCICSPYWVLPLWWRHWSGWWCWWWWSWWCSWWWCWWFGDDEDWYPRLVLLTAIINVKTRKPYATLHLPPSTFLQSFLR